MDIESRSKLIQIAAKLARGDSFPSDNSDDLRAWLPKATPIKVVSELVRQNERARDAAQIMAIEIKGVVDREIQAEQKNIR